jgi:riboflavin synthase alpha subunit
VFTGLVREIGRVERIGARGAVTVLDVSAPRTAVGLAVGDSLAVNGICLTVTRVARGRVRVEATGETRRVTTLGLWRQGETVHLEPSLKAGDPLGGHFVLGHVDGVGRVVSLSRRGGTATLRVRLPGRLAAQLVPKGAIAVDGVSLTLDEGPFDDGFSITLIPHTLAGTRFGRVAAGDAVNLELDVLTKTARPTVATSADGRDTRPPLTLASLLARGWSAREGNP